MIKVNVDKTAGMRRVGKKNKQKVEAWFLQNPDTSVTDCANATGLSWPTVKRHVVAIQGGE